MTHVERYEQFVRTHHANLMSMGREWNESQEADALRDSIEGIWRTLTRKERKRMRALSIDLYRQNEGRIER